MTTNNVCCTKKTETEVEIYGHLIWSSYARSPLCKKSKFIAFLDLVAVIYNVSIAKLHKARFFHLFRKSFTKCHMT